MRALFSIITLCIFSFQFSQSIVFGTVLDENHQPVYNVNVYIKNTYDGISTNAKGEFSIKTEEKGTQTLIFEKTSYQTDSLQITIPITENIKFVFQKITQLQDVVFLAGSMRAKSNTNVSMLSALDVVTTASALGDAIGAFQTLPGTNSVGEDGRLFIRGGEANESSIYIDRMRVFQPYNAQVANSPTRSRFSPFLFKGINLSSGGYDVPFGQALSGIVELETEDFPRENSVDISAMTLGAGLAFNKIFGKNAITTNLSYINLLPYNEVFETRDEFQKSPESYGGETIYRHKFEKGILKSYFSYEKSKVEVTQENINYPEGLHFLLDNGNFYTNNSYTHKFNKKTEGFVGLALSTSDTDLGVNTNSYNTKEFGLNAKMEIDWKINHKNILKIGNEIIQTNVDNTDKILDATLTRKETIYAAYAEHQWFFFTRFGLKTGLRTENSSFVGKWNLSPRVSLAYKMNPYSNFSAMFGSYYQSPTQEILYQNPTDFMRSEHYLLNYFYKKEKQLIRVELFRKDYHNLLRNMDDSFVQNGNGFAQGIDLFWRNNASHIKNFNYWISYSYIDTKRLYQDFPEKAQPSFVANHNFSLVGKYWISSIRSQIGFSYQFNSGRPFTDKNTDGFLAERTKTFNNLSLDWSYLISPQMIIYASVTNVLNLKNVYNYQYANTVNSQGFFDRQAITPSNNQFFFVGFFWTISTDKTKNQLDKL